MRPSPWFIFCLCLAIPVWGASDAARQAQVTAATANAVDAIDQEVGNQPLGSAGTIRDFLRQTHSDAVLRDWLNHSQPVGGPRWLDEQTCQVRIEVDGNKISDQLLAIAQAHPQTSPMDIAALRAALADLRQRQFEATSTSASGDTLNNLAPAEAATSWQSITPDHRRQVLIAARQNAVDRVLALIGPIQLSDGRTITQAISANPRLHQQLLAYLQTAPVTSVDFQSDLQARIELRPSHEELAEIIYAAVNNKTSADFGADDFHNLQDLRAHIADRIAQVAGTASAATANTNPPPTVIIPADPPAWVDDQLDVVGHGFVPGSQLKSAHAAEHDAMINLRNRLQALHLDNSHTVLDAGTRDPHIADAINQTLEQARPYKSDFNSDGSVTTHEILDLHDFWQALTGSQ